MNELIDHELAKWFVPAFITTFIAFVTLIYWVGRLTETLARVEKEVERLRSFLDKFIFDRSSHHEE